MKTAKKPKTIHQKKRYGHHQKRSKVFAHTYLPYLPMTLILLLSVFISGYTPKTGTLAYATNVSQSGLLSATNARRSENGKNTLTLNSQLSSAAQAKANDMIARNYWSHNTPDGQEPWVFINNAGYSYIKAGENLAYGFATSADTVTGWMNSPTHKDNMLDSDFSEVGFGFANGSNYNSAGEETVVVAMYGKPYVLASTAQAEPASPAPTPAPVPTTPVPTTTTTPEPTPAPQPSTETAQEKKSAPKDTKTPAPQPTFVAASAKPVSRIETLTSGSYPWILSVVSFSAGTLVTVLLLRHGIRFKRLLRDGQNFVTHHPLIDSTILALIILGITLTRTVGFIS